MKTETKIAVPKDAATIILLKDEKVLWAQRNHALKFLGGWHAFPGGKLEATDAEIRVENSTNSELDKFIVCAVRETFEEVGVLLVRGGEKLTRGQFASLHDDLISGRMSFREILEHWELRIHAEDFFYTGFWTTPQFSPVRFKTRFFLAKCPPKQKPYAAITELENVEFIEPEEALKHWKKSEVIISPPVLITLKELADSTNLLGNSANDSREFSVASIVAVSEKLLANSRKFDGQINYIELNPRVICFPLKSETIPPATHTNCFIVGKKQFVVIDAAAKNADEQNLFHEFIDSLVEKNFHCQAIITTHSHPDHFGGETALQKHFLEKFGMRVPLLAHKFTAESLTGKVKFERLIDDEIFQLQDGDGKIFELKTIYAPGHAGGHLCFYDAEFGFLLSGDNVVGADSVIIAAPEGDMIDYLDSLEKLKVLPNLKFLCGSHGAAISDARAKIESYIAHRLKREQKILTAIGDGTKSIGEIVEKVYADTPQNLWKLAEKSVEAHLKKLETEGKIPALED